MLVVTTIRFSNGFQAWKDMVHSVEDKMQEHGMTFVFAGTEKDDDTMLHTVIHFESEEHLKRFGADKELTRLREEAGAIVETGTFTPITSDTFINYPKVLKLN